MAVFQTGSGRHGIVVNLPDIPLHSTEVQKQLINDLTHQTMQLALQVAAGRISDEAPVDSGALAQSFLADPAGSDGGIEINGRDVTQGMNGRVFSSLAYAVVMNDGRQPGMPISRVGIDAIGLWAQRKLGLSADEANRAKWAIAATIRRKGIKGTRYFETGVGQAAPEIQQLFSILSGQIGKMLVQPGGAKGGAA